MVSAPLMSSTSSSASATHQSSQHDSSPPDHHQQDQQQLYYAQLLAAQQQAITAAAVACASSSTACSNSSIKNGNSNNNHNNHNSDKNNDDGCNGDSEEKDNAANKKESDREKKEREWSERNTNLIVNYVPQSMSQDEVRSLFSSMGAVESCKLIRDKATGQSLGYAFVNYERPEDAQKALISMSGLRIQNKTLKVSLARPSKDDIKGANLYVSGLPKSLTQPELEAAFRPFGSIITSRILYDNVTGLSKGVGFVRFDRKFEAEQAIEKMTGTFPWGGDEAVAVKFANSPSTNTTKTTAIQMAQSLLPLQMLQPVSSSSVGSAIPISATAAQHQLSLPSLLPALVPSAAQSTPMAAGGPIHAHTPQHRFRYSPLAGAPLISTSAPVVSSTGGGAGFIPTALSTVNPLINAASSAVNTSALHHHQQQQQQEYLAAALLQQQLLQQQLAAAYSTTSAANANSHQQQAAANLSSSISQQMAAAAQQQYNVYAAALATSTLPTVLCAQPVVTNGAQHQSKSPSSTSAASAIAGWTVSVRNLTPETTDESLLWKLFGPFGAVLSVKAVKSKGIGLVTMANYEEAVGAIGALNGQQLAGRTLQVSFNSQQAAATGQNVAIAAALPSLLRS